MQDEQSDQDLSDGDEDQDDDDEDDEDDEEDDSDDPTGAKRKAKMKEKKDLMIANRALRIKMGKSGAQAASRRSIKKGKDACQRKLWNNDVSNKIPPSFCWAALNLNNQGIQ